MVPDHAQRKGSGDGAEDSAHHVHVLAPPPLRGGARRI
jgi:hypothetical protein